MSVIKALSSWLQRCYICFGLGEGNRATPVSDGGVHHSHRGRTTDLCVCVSVYGDQQRLAENGAHKHSHNRFKSLT